MPSATFSASPTIRVPCMSSSSVTELEPELVMWKVAGPDGSLSVAGEQPSSEIVSATLRTFGELPEVLESLFEPQPEMNSSAATTSVAAPAVTVDDAGETSLAFAAFLPVGQSTKATIGTRYRR